MSQLGRSAGLTGFLDLAREMGVDAPRMAASVGLPPEVLTNPDLRISVEAMGAMYEMAATLSGADDFALRVAENRRLSNIGALGLVMREQHNLRRALQTYARFQWLQNDAYALELKPMGELFMLRINGPPWQQRQIAELSAATGLRNIQSLMRPGWKPQEVWFTHPAPAKIDTHRRVLGVTPLFDQDCMAIIIRRDDLDAPIAQADPLIAKQVTAYLEQLTAERPVGLRDKVGEIVTALLPEGVCSVERVARHLGMDRRTLHRRLTTEGTTFSEILDDTRRDMAASLLTGSDRQLQAIADLLGFSSLSAFAHWFRRNFAQSASAYRMANAGAALRPSGSLAAAL